jgi:NAD(P)-dependent dehydrogenase (short-subunit alcohol dehydrogenase family)
MNAGLADELFDLSGHTAFVTGASGGLGRHFALVLAQAGAAVAVGARRADKLAELVEEIQAAGGRAAAVSLDVGSRRSIQAALNAAAGKLGTPDIIVNNAGVTATRRVLEYSDEDWDSVMATNLRGAWIVAQEAAKRLVAAGQPGSIINISSIYASRVSPGVVPYTVSKAGVKQLTRVLALEFARFGIRVNAIAPGYIATDLNRDFLASEAGQRLRARVPAQRFGEIHELDGTLLLLASKAGAYISGAEIAVDGAHLCNTL